MAKAKSTRPRATIYDIMREPEKFAFTSEAKKKYSLARQVHEAATALDKARFAYLDYLVEELRLPKYDNGRYGTLATIDDIIKKLTWGCCKGFARPNPITKKEVLAYVSGACN